MSNFKLSPQQLEAVHTTADDLLCIAGPGAGKTRVLVERIVALIAGGVPASQIVAITFTNAAARELERRIDEAMIPDGWPSDEALPPRDRLGFCGTIHGFMLWLLRRFGESINLPSRIAVADERMSDAIIEQTIKATHYRGKKEDLTNALELGPFFAREKGNRLTAAEITAAAFYDTMQTGGLLNYDGILHYGLRLLETWWKDHFCAWPFNYLFVDELQDSSDLFFRVFNRLPMAHKFFIGDPDQSIYSFMGANVGNIMHYGQNRSVRVVVMEGNYRCAKQICVVAQRLIEHNAATHRFAKSTVSMREAAGNVEIRPMFPNPYEELLGIVHDIQEERYEPTDCAVLFRYNFQVDEAVKTFEGLGLTVARKRADMKPKDWGKVRALVNLLVNPFNDVLAADYLRQYPDQAHADEIVKHAAASFTAINALAWKFPPTVELADLGEILARQDIGIESRELIDAHLAELPTDATMIDLSFALGSELGHQKEEGRGLTVTTIHSAKGREWGHVYLPAFEQAIMPGNKTGHALEEERRLAYVAVTRAKDSLVISSSTMRTPQFKYRAEPTELSQFVKELTYPTVINL